MQINTITGSYRTVDPLRRSEAAQERRNSFATVLAEQKANDNPALQQAAPQEGAPVVTQTVPSPQGLKGLYVDVVA